MFQAKKAPGGLHTSVLAAADIGQLKRVEGARQNLLKETLVGDLPENEREGE